MCMHVYVHVQVQGERRGGVAIPQPFGALGLIGTIYVSPKDYQALEAEIPAKY